MRSLTTTGNRAGWPGCMKLSARLARRSPSGRPSLLDRRDHRPRYKCADPDIWREVAISAAATDHSRWPGGAGILDRGIARVRGGADALRRPLAVATGVAGAGDDRTASR